MCENFNFYLVFFENTECKKGWIMELLHPYICLTFPFSHQGECDLLSLLQVMVVVFGDFPPVSMQPHPEPEQAPCKLCLHRQEASCHVVSKQHYLCPRYEFITDPKIHIQATPVQCYSRFIALKCRAENNFLLSTCL